MFSVVLRSLEHHLKELREEEDETMAGQRGGRIAKWIASNEASRKKAGLTGPEVLKCLSWSWMGLACFVMQGLNLCEVMQIITLEMCFSSVRFST